LAQVQEFGADYRAESFGNRPIVVRFVFVKKMSQPTNIVHGKETVTR
jgi:hypothetical protein